MNALEKTSYSELKELLDEEYHYSLQFARPLIHKTDEKTFTVKITRWDRIDYYLSTGVSGFFFGCYIGLSVLAILLTMLGEASRALAIGIIFICAYGFLKFSVITIKDRLKVFHANIIEEALRCIDQLHRLEIIRSEREKRNNYHSYQTSIQQMSGNAGVNLIDAELSDIRTSHFTINFYFFCWRWSIQFKRKSN